MPRSASRLRVPGVTRSPTCRTAWRGSIARAGFAASPSAPGSSSSARASRASRGASSRSTSPAWSRWSRHSLPVAIPRRPDRRAGREPRGAGRDHRRRHRRFRHRRQLRHLHRPRPAARTAAGRELRRRRRHRPRILDQSGARRAGAAPPDLADQDARPHLRPQRLSASLDSRNLYIPGEVVRLDLPPPNEKKPNVFKRDWNAFRSGSATATCRSIASSAPTPARTIPEVARGARRRQERLHGARRRSRPGHRLGGGAGAALPRGARRAAAVDARRRHQPGGRGGAAADRQAVRHPAGRHGGAVDPARPHASPAR